MAPLVKHAPGLHFLIEQTREQESEKDGQTKTKGGRERCPPFMHLSSRANEPNGLDAASARGRTAWVMLTIECELLKRSSLELSDSINGVCISPMSSDGIILPLSTQRTGHHSLILVLSPILSRLLCGRVVRAERLLVHREGLLAQARRLLGVALLLQHKCEVVQASGSLWVLFAQRLLRDLERLPAQRLGLLGLSLWVICQFFEYLVSLRVRTCISVPAATQKVK